MSYKLSRYFDPSGAMPPQWEMYDMDGDPNETTNLVEVQNTPPTVRHDIHGPRRDELQRKANELAALVLFTGLGIAPAEALFLDDRQDNVDGSCAVGLRGEVYTTWEDFVASGLPARYALPAPDVAEDVARLQ